MAAKSTKSDSQNSDTTARSGRELYHLQFSLQAASPETFGYSLVLTIYFLYFQASTHQPTCVWMKRESSNFLIVT
jgi:hypothetical protein